VLAWWRFMSAGISDGGIGVAAGMSLIISNIPISISRDVALTLDLNGRNSGIHHFIPRILQLRPVLEMPHNNQYQNQHSHGLVTLTHPHIGHSMPDLLPFVRRLLPFRPRSRIRDRLSRLVARIVRRLLLRSRGGVTFCTSLPQSSRQDTR